ncbi:MAG: tetratricopeptide repeat protein [Cyanobacteria bacterium P01_H01_bin.74]
MQPTARNAMVTVLFQKFYLKKYLRIDGPIRRKRQSAVFNHRNVKTTGNKALYILFLTLIGLSTVYNLSVLPANASQPDIQSQNLQTVVQQGNLAADKKNYALAIKHYKRAIQLDPTNKSLQKNLTVILINAGVEKQNQEDFTQAFSYFEQAGQANPNIAALNDSINGAIADAHYGQAMSLREIPDQNTGHYNYHAVREALEKALQKKPDNPLFRRSLAGVYMDEAYPLAIDEQFEQARVLLEKAHGIDPGNKTVKGSLANIYIALAQKFPEKYSHLTDKALVLDHSPRIQSVVERMQLANPEARANNAAQFSMAVDDIQASPPPEMRTLSVHQMLSDLELQLAISPAENQDIVHRLARVEQQVYGKAGTGPVALRAKAVYTSMMGSYTGKNQPQEIQLAQKKSPFKTKDNYLDRVFAVTDGKVIRWGKFPLRLYFEPPEDNNSLYQEQYKQAALAGFTLWKKATKGFANVVEIQDPSLADITVHWGVSAYSDRFANEEKTPELTKQYQDFRMTAKSQSSRFRNVLRMATQVATMAAPGYFSLAPQAFNAAMQYRQYKNVALIRKESEITLGLAAVKELPPDAQQIFVQNMAARELGHVLGLKTLTENPDDIMYRKLNMQTLKQPSQRDLNTLSALYKLSPNIILNVR